MSTIQSQTRQLTPWPLSDDNQEAYLQSRGYTVKKEENFLWAGGNFTKKLYSRHVPTQFTSKDIDDSCCVLPSIAEKTCGNLCGRVFTYCDPEEETRYGCADKLCWSATCLLFCPINSVVCCFGDYITGVCNNGKEITEELYFFDKEKTIENNKKDLESLGIQPDDPESLKLFMSNSRFANYPRYYPILETPVTKTSKVFYQAKAEDPIRILSFTKRNGNRFHYETGLISQAEEYHKYDADKKESKEREQELRSQNLQTEVGLGLLGVYNYFAQDEEVDGTIRKGRSLMRMSNMLNTTLDSLATKENTSLTQRLLEEDGV